MSGVRLFGGHGAAADGALPRRSLFGDPVPASGGAGAVWQMADPHLRSCQLLYLAARRRRARARTASSVEARWAAAGHAERPGFLRVLAPRGVLPDDLLSEIVDWLPAVLFADTAAAAPFDGGLSGDECEVAGGSSAPSHQMPQRFVRGCRLPSLHAAAARARDGDLIAVAGAHHLAQPLLAASGETLHLVAAAHSAASARRAVVTTSGRSAVLAANTGGRLHVEGLVLCGALAVTCGLGSRVELRNCEVQGGVVVDGDGATLVARHCSIQPTPSGSVMPYGVLCSGGAAVALTRCTISRHNIGVRVTCGAAQLQQCRLQRCRSSAVVAAAGSEVTVQHCDFIESGGCDAQVSGDVGRFALLDSKLQRLDRAAGRQGGTIGVWLIHSDAEAPVGRGEVELARNIFDMCSGNCLVLSRGAAAELQCIAVRQNEFHSAGPAIVDRRTPPPRAPPGAPAAAAQAGAGAEGDRPDGLLLVESNVFDLPAAEAVLLAADGHSDGADLPPSRYHDNRFLNGRPSAPPKAAAPLPSFRLLQEVFDGRPHLNLPVA
eukprot:TRINITY_DN59948_c0_g1_i1.p1 TRINITY_DN59948_c0_g1~~TRINITY_DN59948_c0_g1_i1.p1  ORF type:complete len:548 (+),score=157.98 TRINITY_DN59948_c0_g1_i1:77-1720(+)